MRLQGDRSKRSSSYQKGWSTRASLVDDVSKNSGLRDARLSFYIAKDFLKEGNIEESVNEFKTMLDGLEKVISILAENNQRNICENSF